MKFEIQNMESRDLDEILSIEGEVFPDPWTRGMFEEELSRQPPSLSLVVRDSKDGKLLGYLNSIAIYDELHIGNIAVREEAREQGIGEALLIRALKEARKHSLALATLEVRTTNRVAVALYEKLGFRAVAIRKHYYGNEDAMVMVLSLTSKPSFRAGNG